MRAVDAKNSKALFLYSSLLLLFTLYSGVFGQTTYYSQGTGNFGTTSNWHTDRLGLIPIPPLGNPSDFQQGDIFVIQSGHTITMDNVTNFIQDLTIESGGAFNNSTNTIVFAVGGGTLDVQSGGTYTGNSGTIEHAAGTFATVTLNNGTGSIVVLNNLRTGGTISFTGGTFRIDGTFFYNTSRNISGGSNLAYGTSGTLQYGSSKTVGAEWVSGGVPNVILQSGTATISSSTYAVNDKLTRSGGSISVSGGTLQYISATLEYNHTSPQTVGNEWTSSLAPDNVTVNNSSGLTLGNGSTTLATLTGDLTLTQGAVDYQTTSGSLTVQGNVVGGTGSFGTNNSDVLNVTGTSSQVTSSGSTTLYNLTMSSTSGTLRNITIDNLLTISSGTSTLQGGVTLAGTSGEADITVSTGATLNLNGNTVTGGSGTNTLTVNSGATVQTGGSSLSAFDDLVATSGTLEFSGSGSQETLPTDETIGTVIVNNTSNVATASGTLVIADALTFSNTSGIINTTSSNILELESDVTVTGEDDSHYIDGPVTITSLGTSSSFDVPVGDGSELRNVLVTNGTGASGDITIQYETTNPNVGNNPGVKSTSNNRKWTITPAASGIQQFDVQLTFTSPGFTIADEDAIRILRGTSGSSDWTITDDTPTIDTGNDLVATNGTVLTGTSPVNFTIAEVGGAISWDGEGADGQWNTASNWSGDAVPTSADDVTIDVSGGVTVTIGSSVAAVAQSLTIGDAGGAGSNNNLAVNSTQASPLTITNALTVYDDGALVFNASNGDISAGSTSFSSGSSVEYQQRLIPVDTYGYLTINGATGVSGSGTVTVNANLTKNGGAFTSSETFTVSGTYTGTAGDATYNGGLTVNGSTFTVNGGSVSGTVTLSGSGTQSIEGTGSEIDFDALTINNSSGITVNNPISVAGVLTLTDGLVNTSELNLLTIGTSGTISNPSQDFINGPMANQNTSNMLFAIGKGSDYRPVELENVSGTPTVRFEMFNGDPGGSPGTGVNNISTVRYWKAQVITGSITCRVELHWGSDDGVDGDTNDDLIVVQSINGSGGTYDDIGNFSNGTDWVQSNPTSIRTVAADYFTFGSLTGDNALPVELAAFEALADYGKVTLNWTTASEINNQGFNIYRSVDNDNNWNKVNSTLIEGHGTVSYSSDYSFVDSKIVTGETYRYKLESVNVNGLAIEEKTIEVTIPIPDQYALFNNYPNPFNPTTNIKFQLPEAQQVKLLIYNMNGSLVTTLVNNQLYPSGEHIVNWDATDNAGSRVATGIYLYRFQAGSFVKTGKMILMK